MVIMPEEPKKIEKFYMVYLAVHITMKCLGCNHIKYYLSV